MEMSVCQLRAHAGRGSNFLLRRQKKVTKEKVTPTFALIQDLKRKRRAVRNSLRSNNGPLHRRFHFKSWGRIHGDPVGQIFDRFAMKFTKTEMWLRCKKPLPCFPNFQGNLVAEIWCDCAFIAVFAEPTHKLLNHNHAYIVYRVGAPQAREYRSNLGRVLVSVVAKIKLHRIDAKQNPFKLRVQTLVLLSQRRFIH